VRELDHELAEMLTCYVQAPVAEPMMIQALLSWTFVCIFQFYWSYQVLN
jgi:hypothetical protein